MPGPTLSAKLDPEVLLKLGDLKKAGAAVEQGIKQIERDALKAMEQGKKLDAETEARLKRFEEIDSKIKKQAADAKRLAEEDEKFIEETKRHIDELSAKSKLVKANEQAAKIAVRNAKEEAAAIKKSTHETKEALEGLKGIVAGEAARKLIRGESLDAGDVAKFIVAGERGIIKGIEKFFGDSSVLKAAKGAFAAAPIVGEAIAAMTDAFDKVAENRKYDQAFGRLVGSGRFSRGEQLAFDSQFSDALLRRFWLDPEKAVENVRSAGSAFANLHGSDFAFGQERARGNSSPNLAENLTDKTQLKVLSDSLDKVVGNSGYTQTELQNVQNFVREESEKLVKRGVNVTPEIRAQLKEEAVKSLIGTLEARGLDIIAKNLGRELRERAQEAVKDAEKSARLKDRYELEREAAEKRQQDFINDNFRKEMYSRWRSHKVPAHIAD